jgi:hypothetical protein
VKYSGGDKGVTEQIIIENAVCDVGDPDSYIAQMKDVKNLEGYYHGFVLKIKVSFTAF